MTRRPDLVIAGILGPALVALVGCADVLGGLEEGAPRPTSPPRSSPPSPDAQPASRCGDPRWLQGWSHRLPLHIGHVGAPVTSYQLRVALDTREDLGDLRVTDDRGQLLPYWIDLAVAPPNLWVRSDLNGETKLWLYGGAPSETSTSSMTRTFVEGVIDDPTFDRTDAWTGFVVGWVSSTSSTNEWALRLGGGSARLWITRKGHDPNGAGLGLCQTMVFPLGSEYVLDFEAKVAISEHGWTRMTRRDGSENEVTLWRANRDVGVSRVSSLAIPAGVHTICLESFVEFNDAGQAEDVTFSTLRVRRLVEPEPEVLLAGPWESCP